MGVVIAVILTILILVGGCTALTPVVRATDNSYEWPFVIAAVFGWIVYALADLAIITVLIIVVWMHSGVSLDDRARVGDIRCQRYEEHFNGKTTTSEWRTIQCVQIGR